jgi:hypothetical protein
MFPNFFTSCVIVTLKVASKKFYLESCSGVAKTPESSGIFYTDPSIGRFVCKDLDSLPRIVVILTERMLIPERK